MSKPRWIALTGTLRGLSEVMSWKITGTFRGDSFLLCTASSIRLLLRVEPWPGSGAGRKVGGCHESGNGIWYGGI